MTVVMKCLSWKIVCFICISLFACQSIAREPVEEKAALRVLDSVELAKYKAGLTYFFDSLLNNNRFSGGNIGGKKWHCSLRTLPRRCIWYRCYPYQIAEHLFMLLPLPKLSRAQLYSNLASKNLLESR
jgi:hypothetical protein